jgi:hypothetical protein
VEVLQDPTPAGLIRGAPSVALVHDDQVKVVWRVLLVETRARLILGERLIEGEWRPSPGLLEFKETAFPISVSRKNKRGTSGCLLAR